MSTKVDSQLGLRVTQTIKTAGDLLDAAQTELQQAGSKIAAEKADTDLSSPIAKAAIEKLATLVIGGDSLVDPADLPSFFKSAETRHGLASILNDVVEVLAKHGSADKTASELGAPSKARDPYGSTSKVSATGFGSLPRKRATM